MVALPGKLFYSTPIAVCLWFLAKNKHDGKRRDRRKQTLFIDASKHGREADRTHNELAEEDIQIIASTYHAWRGDNGSSRYEDSPGFCKAATTDEIATHGYALTPGRYVGAETALADSEVFDEKMSVLGQILRKQIATSRQLEKRLEDYLSELGL